jgi:hypothetical protein
MTIKNRKPMDHEKLSSNLLKHHEINRLIKQLANDGFSSLDGQTMHGLLFQDCMDPEEEWHRFQRSWERLERDAFMADGGMYRFRRHGHYTLDNVGHPAQMNGHQPHYQSRRHNKLNGGAPRYFATLEPAIANSFILNQLINICSEVFRGFSPEQRWHIEVHQFRIKASATVAFPTPEGVHRDGVDFVFMMMIERQRIRGGITTIYNSSGKPIKQHTLSDALETLFLDDHCVLHGVSPIAPTAPTAPTALGDDGHRDMLVITFKKA